MLHFSRALYSFEPLRGDFLDAAFGVALPLGAAFAAVLPLGVALVVAFGAALRVLSRPFLTLGDFFGAFFAVRVAQPFLAARLRLRRSASASRFFLRRSSARRAALRFSSAVLRRGLAF